MTLPTLMKIEYRSPLWLSWRHRDLTARVGFTYPWPRWMRLNVGFRFHLGFEKDGEWPGLHLHVTLMWLTLYAHLGGCWQDEDGESRSLATMGVYLNTYGLRYIGCWLGHRPVRHDYPRSDHYFVECTRCHATLDHDLR